MLLIKKNNIMFLIIESSHYEGMKTIKSLSVNVDWAESIFDSHVNLLCDC